MGPTPNLPRPLRNRALQTIIVLKKWQIRPRPLCVCVNIPAVAKREYQNPPASAPRMCERSLMIHIGHQARTRRQSYKFRKIAKNYNFEILQQTLHTVHLMELLNKMCKYEMYPANIVEDTERKRFCPHTETIIPCFQLCWSWGFNKNWCFQNGIFCPGLRELTLLMLKCHRMLRDN